MLSVPWLLSTSPSWGSACLTLLLDSRRFMRSKVSVGNNTTVNSSHSILPCVLCSHFKGISNFKYPEIIYFEKNT